MWFSLQINGTENGWSNIEDFLAENIQLQMSVLRQNICIKFNDGWAKYKEKVPDVSDSSQNV